MSVLGSSNLDKHKRENHSEDSYPPTQETNLPSLGDYLSSLEKKLDFCTNQLTKQSVMMGKILALQEVKSSENNSTNKSSKRIPVIDI